MDKTTERAKPLAAALGIKEKLISLVLSKDHAILKPGDRTIEGVFVSPGFIEKLKETEVYHVFTIPDVITGQMKPSNLFLNSEFADTLPTFPKFQELLRFAVVAKRTQEGPLKPSASEIEDVIRLQDTDRKATLALARLKGEDDAELLLLKEALSTSTQGIRDSQRRRVTSQAAGEQDQEKIESILSEHFVVEHVNSLRAPDAELRIRKFFAKSY